MAIEGVVGVGKSTVASDLTGGHGALLRFPPAFHRFRLEVGLDRSVPGVPRLAYYLAGALHLSDLVRRAVLHGDAVCDRYLASPMALIAAEGAVRGTDIDRYIRPFLDGVLSPDLTVLLTAEHAVVVHRMTQRNDRAKKDSSVHQRSIASPTLFRRWEAELRDRVARLGPVAELDTTALERQEMCRAVRGILQDRLAWGRAMPFRAGVGPGAGGPEL